MTPLKRFSKVRHLVPLLAVAMALSACGLNLPTVATQVVTVPPPATSTLAPMPTMTSRFTATPIPTATLLPSATLPSTETPTPEPPTLTPTPASTLGVRGSVALDKGPVNLRIEPTSDGKIITSVPSSTALTIISASPDRQWYLVMLESGQQGWMSSQFVTVPNATAIPAVPFAELTQRASQATGTPRASGTPKSSAQLLPYRDPLRTDILAYCDLPDFRKDKGGRSFTSSQALTVYWTWFAQSAEQIQDQLDYGVYQVSLELKTDGQFKSIKTFDNWKNYQTRVETTSKTRLEVGWFVPIGTLLAGDYRVSFKLTWTQQISDGDKTYGPGGKETVNTGSCEFSVK